MTQPTNRRLVTESKLATDLASVSGAVDSVNGQTGVVVLDAADVGLGNVDNTSDANKPISNPQATALATKVSVVVYAGDLAVARPTADAVYWVDFPSQPTNAQSQDIVATAAVATQYPYLAVVPAVVAPSASNGVVSTGYQAGSIYNTFINASNVLGNYLEWEVMLAAGTYALRLVYAKGTNAGISTISIDGVDLGTTVDQYGTFLANQIVNIPGVVVATDGRHKVRFRSTAKFTDATGYTQTIQGFSLTRTGA